MVDYEKTCEELVEKCKHEAKQLVEFTATRRKVHWTHPSFVSFCVSVEDILSYGVKRRYQSFRSKLITPSGRVLQDLGKSMPEAADLYDKCFSSNLTEKEDYTFVHDVSMAERKVGWIRAALVEGKLQLIIGKIMKNPKQFYTKQSVLCHRVYGDIFQSLVDGPCSIRYSRLKTSDIAIGSPSPAEIVERHNQVLSISTIKGKQDDGGESIATEAAWDHVRSLYQSNSSTCLFGKNNIMVQPAGFAQPVQGYLTLLQDIATLMLKWIPNALLQDSTSAQSALWKTVMSIDIVNQIAHIHCHRTPGHSAELILIGYDGIAHPPLLFPHQPSFFLFLECLENSLLPQGCLEPPLWYIKDMTTKSTRAKGSDSLEKFGLKTNNQSGTSPVDEGEWFDAMEVWNQVFRVRYGPRPKMEESEEVIIHAAPPPIPNLLSLNLTNHSRRGSFESSESGGSNSEESDHTPLQVTVEKPGSLARGDWEKFQFKVTRQLLARYFYSWLSHCRYMSKVRACVSHLVGATVLHPKNHTHINSGLTREEWDAFLQLKDRQKRWSELIEKIYFGGVNHNIRKEVWPFLLGLYPMNSTEQEREDILRHSTEQYTATLAEWKSVEDTKKEVELEAVLVNGYQVRNREASASLSTISPSPSDSPSKSPGSSPDLSNDISHDRSHDQYDDLAVFDTQSHDENSFPSPNRSHEHSPSKHSKKAEASPGHSEGGRLEENLEATPDHSNQEDDLQEVPPPPVLSPDPIEAVMLSLKLDSKGKLFAKELYNIDKDIPRCDRDYWYFQKDSNLSKLRNVMCSFVWGHINEGYSQGMCDLLSPLLVILDNEVLAYSCYLKIMESAIKLFPPHTLMNTRLANVQILLQVMEPEFHQYLADRPMGDGLFYAYRWLLVSFKREFCYDSIFRLLETIWVARINGITQNFEEFFALAIMKQFKSAIMDAHLDPSDILNLFTDLAEKHAIDGEATIKIAQEIIQTLQSDLTRKDC